MSRAEVIYGLAAGVLLAGMLRADDKAPAKVELKADKGQTAEFVVKRTSTMEGSGGQQGDYKRTEESEVEYRIEVAEKKDGGDLVLKVSYGAVKAKAERRDGPWEFDSAKKEGGDEAATAIREAISKPITVEVKKGRVTDIVGLPEAARPEGGGGDGFRGMRGARIAGREALRRDLEIILATPVQGEALEKGKVYRPAAEERRAESTGEGERKGRGGRFGRGGFGQPRLAYKFEGDEKVGNVPAAKFSLSADRPETQGQARVDAKSEGSAVISLQDGLLLKLEVDASTSFELERDGQKITNSTKTKTTVARKEAAKGAERTASRF